MAMTRVFVFTNHKGGVGKSTSATNIAFGMVGLSAESGGVQLPRAADRHRLASSCDARHDWQEGLRRRRQSLYRA